MSEPTLYEAMYIFDPSLPDDEAAELMDSFEEVVREGGGEVVGTRDFRTRRLAYVIDGHTHGAYRLLYFHGEGDVVETLRTEMAIRQPVIRSRVFVANPQAIVGGPSEEEAAEVEGEEAAEVENAATPEERAEAPAAAQAEAAEEAVEAAAADESAGPEEQQTPEEGE